jgi:transporter family-2 protein
MSTPAAGSSFGAIAALMFAGGIGIPVMATLNAGLGRQLASPAAATVILFGGGLALSAVLLLVNGAPPLARYASVPPGFYLGAIFVVLYIFSITWAAPRIGVGNAVFFVLLGQLVAAAAIDHLGLWGALVAPLTIRRTIGIAVMAVGVYLAKKQG